MQGPDCFPNLELQDKISDRFYFKPQDDAFVYVYLHIDEERARSFIAEYKSLEANKPIYYWYKDNEAYLFEVINDACDYTLRTQKRQLVEQNETINNSEWRPCHDGGYPIRWIGQQTIHKI